MRRKVRQTRKKRGGGGIMLTVHVSYESWCLRQTQGYCHSIWSATRPLLCKQMGGGLGSHKLWIIMRYLRLFYVCSHQPPWHPNREAKIFTFPDPQWDTRGLLNIVEYKASHWRGSTHGNWKNERFGTATETLMLSFCVTPIIMAVGSVATFQIRVG